MIPSTPIKNTGPCSCKRERCSALELTLCYPRMESMERLVDDGLLVVRTTESAAVLRLK